jgi:hypothetical protein
VFSPEYIAKLGKNFKKVTAGDVALVGISLAMMMPGFLPELVIM